MAYTNEVREKAFELYFNDTPVEQICDKIKPFAGKKISKDTLWKWKKKYNWDARKEKLLDKTREKAGEKLTDIKLRQLAISKKIQAQFVEQLNDKENPKIITTNEAVKAMQHEMLIMGEATERVENTGDFSVRIQEAYKEQLAKRKKLQKKKKTMTKS